MVVAIHGFGSVWERRFGKDASDPERFARAAYYNTTAVPVNSKLRCRWRVGGKLRFNSASGFDVNFATRAMGRAFECAALVERNGWSQILFERVLPANVQPEMYLFGVTTKRIGYIDAHSVCWKSDSVRVVLFSEDHRRQELLLLMPVFLVRGELGTFFVKPSPAAPCSACLQLGAFRKPMRYPKRTIIVSRTMDILVLEYVLRCGFATNRQLFEFLLLDHLERSRAAFEQRLRRLAHHDLIRKCSGLLAGHEWVYSITLKGASLLVELGELLCRARSVRAGTRAVRRQSLARYQRDSLGIVAAAVAREVDTRIRDPFAE